MKPSVLLKVARPPVAVKSSSHAGAFVQGSSNISPKQLLSSQSNRQSKAIKSIVKINKIQRSGNKKRQNEDEGELRKSAEQCLNASVVQEEDEIEEPVEVSEEVEAE